MAVYKPQGARTYEGKCYECGAVHETGEGDRRAAYRALRAHGWRTAGTPGGRDNSYWLCPACAAPDHAPQAPTVRATDWAEAEAMIVAQALMALYDGLHASTWASASVPGTWVLDTYGRRHASRRYRALADVQSAYPLLTEQALQQAAQHVQATQAAPKPWFSAHSAIQAERAMLAKYAAGAQSAQEATEQAKATD